MTRRLPAATSRVVTFAAYLTSDHVSMATGKTVAITISKNGGAFGNPNAGATNAVEIGSTGIYKVTLDATDTNTVGDLWVHGTAAATDNVDFLCDVVAATNGGMTALPATAVTTNASLLTSGTGTAQITAASGQVTVATNNDKTGYALTAAYDPAKTASQAGDAMALTAGERNSTADAFLNRDMSTGTDSGSPTVRTVRQALRFLRNKWAISTGTLTVYKEDDSTSSWTATVGTDAAAVPIVSNDPA